MTSHVTMTHFRTLNFHTIWHHTIYLSWENSLLDWGCVRLDLARARLQLFFMQVGRVLEDQRFRNLLLTSNQGRSHPAFIIVFHVSDLAQLVETYFNFAFWAACVFELAWLLWQREINVSFLVDHHSVHQRAQRSVGVAGLLPSACIPLGVTTGRLWLHTLRYLSWWWSRVEKQRLRTLHHTVLV